VKRVVVEQVAIVAQADEPLRVADELVGQREPDGAIEGIGDEADHEDDEREQEQEGRAGVPPREAAARHPRGPRLRVRADHAPSEP
jgi:hypothetical protein